MIGNPHQVARETLEKYQQRIEAVAKPENVGARMTNEDWLQWLKAFLEEERKQTKALNDLGCMVFAIAIVVVGVAALAFLSGLLSAGLVR